MNKWRKSIISKSVSNTAIMLGQYHIARYITYIDGVKSEKYCLWDCSESQHKQIEWSDDVKHLKGLAEKMLEN